MGNEVWNERRLSTDTVANAPQKCHGASSMTNSKEDDEKPTEIPASITSFLMNDILFPGLMEPYMQQVNEKLGDPNLLEWVTEVLSNRIVGEDLNKLTLFLIALSYKTDDPQGVIFTGPPAIGKSHLTKNVLRLFSNVINLTRITSAVLDRLEVDFSNYILYISELGGHEQATPTLRVMLSEGELRLATTTMENGKILPKVIETTGKPVYVTTTTQEIVERQLASRTWMLNLDVTKEQTKQILRYQARKASSVNKDEYSQDEMALRCLLYKLEDHKVLIPYAEKLSELFPFGETQARRDFVRLLALIKCVALIFQKQRALVESDSEKVLLANLTDMAYALKLVKPILFTTLYALPKKAFEVLDVFIDSNGAEYTAKDVAREVGLSQSRIRRIMNGLVDRAFLYKDDSRKPHKYSWTEKKLEEPCILQTHDLKDFFTREEFEYWFDSNKCTYSEACSDIYRTYILPCTPHALGKVHTIENKLKTTVKTEKKPARLCINETHDLTETKTPPKLPEKTAGHTPIDEKVKAVVALKDTHVDRCARCQKVEVLHWQIETFKGEWGHVCNDCGGLFQDILRNRVP